MKELAHKKATELIFKYGHTEALYLCDVKFWEAVKEEISKSNLRKSNYERADTKITL